LIEEEKSNYEKREAVMLAQKRDMQVEMQRMIDRESKRKKLQAQIQLPANNNNSCTIF
jgi:hypothetical protein